MIKNRRDLANSLSNNGTVKIEEVSKKLTRIVEMWIGYGSVERNGNILIGKF